MEEIASFRGIYQRLTWDRPDDVESLLLGEALDAGRRLIEPLRRHRRFADAPRPVPDEDAWELWELYAVSRVSDYLLLPFQPGEPCEDDHRRVTERSMLRVNTPLTIRPGTPEWKQFGSRTDPLPGTEYVTEPQVPELSSKMYVEFFTALGYATLGDDRPYSPFYHEIFEVIEDPDHPGEIAIDAVIWPGLMFGELLFSRAGVRVRCRPGVLDKESAERSTLHFAFRRRRSTNDLSVGWGHNSQWRTEFQRCYDDGTHLHFNVEGVRPFVTPVDLGADEVVPDQEDPNGHLTLAQRREFLAHRCIVTGWKPGIDPYPYDDTWVVEKGETPWPT